MRLGMTLFALPLLAFFSAAQEDSFSKNFKHFKEMVPGIDFFAANREDVSPYQKSMTEAREKLTALLKEEPKPGAVVICSTLEQKDSVNEARLLKKGFRWVITQVTPEAQYEQLLSQMKAQMGSQVPQGMLDRLKNQSPEAKAMGQARLVSAAVRNMAYSVLTTTLSPDKEFRSSRIDDVGRSPLEDWLDIGIAAHVAGNPTGGLRFLQERLDEGFPLEDLLGMARPFVPPSTGSGESGGMVIRFAGGPGQGPPSGAVPAPAPGASRGPTSISMPKDVQDRMLFDQQSTALFAYVLEKAGMDKARELLKWNREGKSAREILIRQDFLGPDLDKAEKEWQAWVKGLKTENPMMRITAPPPAGGRPPQNP